MSWLSNELAAARANLAALLEVPGYKRNPIREYHLRRLVDALDSIPALVEAARNGSEAFAEALWGETHMSAVCAYAYEAALDASDCPEDAWGYIGDCLFEDIVEIIWPALDEAELDADSLIGEAFAACEDELRKMLAEDIREGIEEAIAYRESVEASYWQAVH